MTDDRPRGTRPRHLLSVICNLTGGFPHSDIPGSKGALASPGLIAECHVLHRLLLPRHPPNALIALDPIQRKTGPFACGGSNRNPSPGPGRKSSTEIRTAQRPDGPRGQCIDLERLSLVVLPLRCLRTEVPEPPNAGRARSPLGADPKTSRVLALFTMS